MTNLEDLIEERFPDHLGSLEAFADFFETFLDDVRGPALGVVEALERNLETESTRMIQVEGIERDHWRIFGKEHLLKSARSSCSKIARDLQDEETRRGSPRERLSSGELRDQLLGFSDLGRCRVVCTLDLDVRHLLDRLIVSDTFMNSYRLRGEVKDFIWDGNRRGGLKGHRARQFSVSVPLAIHDGELGFEVQLMTVLQHAWDRRNHPIYEHTREGGTLSDELLVNDFACSESLHLIDQQANRNWKDFLEQRTQRQPK